MFRSAPEAVAQTVTQTVTAAPAAPSVPAADASPTAGVRPGDVLVVEAGTAELALQEVAAKLGDRVEILAAERVRRGGLGGFFAKELCRLTVRVPVGDRSADARAADADALLASMTDTVVEEGPAEPAGLDDKLRRLADESAAQEADFAAVLRRRMGADLPEDQPGVDGRVGQAARAAQAAQVSLLGRTVHVATGVEERLDVAPLPTPRPQPSADVAEAPRIKWTRDPKAPEGTGPVRWSAGMLERLGMPPALIAAVEAQQPVDDAGWVVALAAAVAPYCRPLPAGDAVLVGPRAAVLGQALGLAVSKRPEQPASEGPVCLPLRDTMPAREWLAGVRENRWLHLVVGGTGWHGLLFDEPLAVSWVGIDTLPAALHQCAAFGLVLGYGMEGPGAALLRANPLDVALSVRSLLPRR